MKFKNKFPGIHKVLKKQKKGWDKFFLFLQNNGFEPKKTFREFGNHCSFCFETNVGVIEFSSYNNMMKQLVLLLKERKNES